MNKEIKMKKYKLINNQTGEEHLCDKIIRDGFDYYVCNEKPSLNDFSFNVKTKSINEVDKRYLLFVNYNDKKVIATNNPAIDIPKIIELPKKLAENTYGIEIDSSRGGKPYDQQLDRKNGFISGYNKSQETHPFSEEDMIEFAKYCNLKDDVSVKVLLQFWKEQQPKTLYYE